MNAVCLFAFGPDVGFLNLYLLKRHPQAESGLNQILGQYTGMVLWCFALFHVTCALTAEHVFTIWVQKAWTSLRSGLVRLRLGSTFSWLPSQSLHICLRQTFGFNQIFACPKVFVLFIFLQCWNGNEPLLLIKFSTTAHSPKRTNRTWCTITKNLQNDWKTAGGHFQCTFHVCACYSMYYISILKGTLSDDCITLTSHLHHVLHHIPSRHLYNSVGVN